MIKHIEFTIDFEVVVEKDDFPEGEDIGSALVDVEDFILDNVSDLINQVSITDVWIEEGD